MASTMLWSVLHTNIILISANLNFECLLWKKKKNPSKQLETVVTKIRKYGQVYFLNVKVFPFWFYNIVEYSASLQFIFLNKSSKLSTLQKAAPCVFCQRAVRMTPNLKAAWPIKIFKKVLSRPILLKVPTNCNLLKRVNNTSQVTCQ